MSSLLVLSPSRVTIYETYEKKLMRKRSHSPRAAAEKVFGVLLHGFGVLPAPSPKAALLRKVKGNRLCVGES